MPLPERDMFCERDILPMAKRYAPDGARYVLTDAIFCLWQSDMPLTERDMPLAGHGLKHLIRATYVAHLPLKGKARGWGKRSPFPSAETQTLLSLRTFPLTGESPKGEGKSVGRLLREGKPLPYNVSGIVAYTTNVVCVPFLLF